MPKVGGKKYSYSKKGMAAAKKASAKSGKPMRTAKPRILGWRRKPSDVR